MFGKLMSAGTITAMVCLLSGCTSSKIESPEPEIASKIPSFTLLKDMFENPPVEYRSAPLWVWNNDVTEHEIDQQLADFKAVGIGGVFIHPRPGLITPYLSDPRLDRGWFSLCRYAVDRAKAIGLRVWLYDENSYPSGFAGGNVPAQMPESYNQGQGLVLHKAAELPDSVKSKYVITIKKDTALHKDVSGFESPFIDITDSVDNEKNQKGDYYLFELAYYGKSPWFGGYSYVDLLLDGVTEKFIDVTMGGYGQAIGDEFGKIVPGIFTDEPNIAPPVGNCIRWTPALFEKFRERWGYDLKTNLPSLFEEAGDWKRVRHNYYGLLLELFIDRWSKPWNQYTGKHTCIWTGHYWEHGWPSPHHGGDNMAMYAWHQMPGIDILMNEYSEDVNAQFGNVRSVKELRSAANQLGCSRTLSETYGAGGWDLRFEDMKRIGDWEYVLGVNFLDQHLSYITIMGARKRDHPQSFSYHEPWWKFYRVQGDYFGRLSLALSSGVQLNRILVIEPTTSAWMYYAPGQAHERVGTIGKSFQDFVQTLERFQIEYDLGSENIIKDHGKAEGGKFVIGKGSYDLIIFPPGVENLDRSTVSLIESYLVQGGRILSFVDTPKYVDGVESGQLQALVSRYPGQWIRENSLFDPSARKYLVSKDFRMIQPENISGKLFHHRRHLNDGELIFLVNTSLSESSTGAMIVRGKSVSVLNPVNGEITPYSALSTGDEVTITFTLFPAGSTLFFVSRASSQGSEPEKKAASGKVVPSSGGLVIRRTAPNTLTLDYCDIKLGKKEYKDIYFYKAADIIFKYYGLAGNPWSMAVQYKTDILDKNTFPKNSGFEARFPFSVDEAADRNSLQAVVERPNLWKVSINGETVEPRPGAWWLDRCFGVYDIGSHVVSGMNYITLTASPMTIHTELEPLYVLGDFGLKPEAKGMKIVPVSPLVPGAWNEQGMPYYSDGVSYTKSYNLSPGNKRYLVRLTDWLGSVAEVRVNRKYAGIIGWQPYEDDITGMVREGSNEITIIVYGTLKNLLGPHHNNPPHGRAWPRMFQDAPEHQPPGEEYDVIGYGMFEDFTVIECE
jgi:hypothetical protein